ncbi:MAG: hypothetical protein HYR72_23840 [Deltaproteobacteria bacterium]|nr:hypothetical protein [Deltaproteobacteria bacterium]MBI3389133.1 hypothetical protein [Deltaproteobacteria bacterium]
MTGTGGYWPKRIRSKAFKRTLTTAVADELRSLAGERIEDVLDGKLVRAIIADWDTRMVNREFVADLLIENTRRAGRRLARQNESLLDLLDAEMVADIDQLLSELAELPPSAEDLIAKMMQQEFVRRLLTDVIYSAIVNFYEKANPLFGALTARVLEEQIKGFIRLFMPMLQKQATAFAVNKQNQRLVLDFARTIIRQLLNEPLRHFAATAMPTQRRKTEAFVHKALGNPNVGALLREVALATWDDLYESIRHKRVGELLQIEAHSAWLADRCVEVILPALARPGILQLLGAEIGLAAGGKP